MIPDATARWMVILSALIPLILAGCAGDRPETDAGSTTSDVSTETRHPLSYPPERSGMFPCTDTMVLHHLRTDTTRLRNGALLYNEGDCDSIRLILERAGERNVVAYYDPDGLPYHYRLGYHLVEEFDDALLFRWGCPASSECAYALHDSRTGALIAGLPSLLETFGDAPEPFLLYIDTVQSARGSYDTLVFIRLSDRTLHRVGHTPGFRDHVRHLWGAYLIDSVAVEGDSVVITIGGTDGDSRVEERRVVEIPFRD